MLLINPHIVILQGTGSQVTPGFPHSQIRLRVASPKVREHSRTTPMAYELASDTYYGLGVVTPRVEVIHMHIWAKLEDALRAKLKAEAAALSTHILGMGLSDITKQILSGASRQEITEVMQEEIQWRNVAISATSCSPPVDKQQSLH